MGLAACSSPCTSAALGKSAARSASSSSRPPRPEPSTVAEVHRASKNISDGHSIVQPCPEPVVLNRSCVEGLLHLEDRPQLQELLFAAATGDVDLAKRVIKEAYVDARISAAKCWRCGDKFGDTPLHLASRAGHASVVNLALWQRAALDIQNVCGETALHLACLGGYAEVTAALCKAGADPRLGEAHSNEIPRLTATRRRAELKSSGLLDITTAVRIDYLACIANCLMVLQKWAPEFAAASLIDSSGRTGLHFAAEASDSNVCALLLRFRAPVDAPKAQGVTPLMLALRAGSSIETVLMLLSAGANPCGRDRCGGTPLHYVVGLGDAGMPLVDMLLHRRADPDDMDARGISPLALAALFDHPGLVKRMRAAGARVVGCKQLLPYMPEVPRRDLRYLESFDPALVYAGHRPLESEVRIRLKSQALKVHGAGWEELVREVDKDNSGHVDWEEFRSMCRTVLTLASKEVGDYELLQVFQAIDEDGSGEISLDELIAFVNDAL